MAMRSANAFMERIDLEPGDRQRDRIWADHIRPVFDVEAFGDAPARGNISMMSMLCGDLIFASFRSPASRVVRSARKVSRLGSDHVHVQFYRRGGSVVRAGKHVTDVRPGHMVVFDLSQPVEVEAESIDALALVVSRSRFETMFGQPEALHGRPFEIGGSVTRKLLHHQLACLAEEAEQVLPAELENISASILALCASCIPKSDVSLYRKQLSPKSTICRHVALHFGSQDLSVTAVSEKFGLSRASLQRIFEAEGGFARYVRELRLQRAFNMLARGGPRRSISVTRVALECGFSDPASFNRSFARHFGFSPKHLLDKPISEAVHANKDNHLSRWMSYIAE